jgi:predicted metalloprotease with PDZ domain
VKPSARARFALALAVFVALFAIEAAIEAEVQDSPRSLARGVVRYEVSLGGASQHLVKVKLHFAPGVPECELQLPVWNALYQIRDFAQYIGWIRARDNKGNPLAVSKVDKSRWRVGGTEGGGEIEYEIFADQPGPFGAQANTHHAFFNLAQILMYPVGARTYPMQVQFRDVPSGWRIATALTASSEGFSAENYDRLVDSPVEISAFQESDFDEGGGHYRVVVDADAADYDRQRMVSTLRRLAAASTDWMKDRPYQTYLFLYHFPRGPAGGGMEHAYSTAIDISADRLRESPLVLSDLTAHEFFHLWNVKRIRPQSLEPIDYTKENYTPALWFSEGVTTTAGNIIRMRAGLLDEAGDLKGLAAEIGELEGRPAHLTQSAEESSLDAWFEKYNYYRLPERSISYYNKGYLLGVLLDLQMREASHDSASLRDVFLLMNQNAREGQYFSDSDGVRQAAELVSHSDLGWFFQKYVAGTEEIPWDKFFLGVGLHLARRTVSVADPGFTSVRNFDAAPRVASIVEGGEAERAGLAVGDDILEINGHAADSDFEQRLAGLHPGETIRLRVRRPQGELGVTWRMANREQVAFELKDVDNVTSQQRARRAAWLRGESGVSGSGVSGEGRL